MPITDDYFSPRLLMHISPGKITLARFDFILDIV
jgi:hypothetical protein